jgi:thiaminase/transcriptional activator TenA
MSERFSEQLRRKLDPVWQAQHQHPFIRGIADGSLEAARFEVWLRQDYLFLIEYARLLSVAAARAPDIETMKWMIAMSHGVLHNEMLMHLAYGIEFGLTREDLETGIKLPTTRAYTDHLLRIGGTGSYVELVAGLLPSIWGCSEIGQRLAQQASQPATGYGRWIDLYSGPLIAKRAQGGRDLLDRLAGISGSRALVLAEDAFAVSSRYEWMFQEMCWRGESWPV